MGRVGPDSAAWTGGRHTPWTEEPPVAGWSPCPRGCPHPLPVLLTRAAEQWGDVTVTVSARASSVGQRVGARRLRPERGSSRGRPSPPAAPRPAPGPPPRAVCRPRAPSAAWVFPRSQPLPPRPPHVPPPPRLWRRPCHLPVLTLKTQCGVLPTLRCGPRRAAWPGTQTYGGPAARAASSGACRAVRAAPPRVRPRTLRPPVPGNVILSKLSPSGYTLIKLVCAPRNGMQMGFSPHLAA